MTRKPYTTDLTIKQWALIKDLIPPEKHGGRHRATDMHEVVNGILYVVKGGIQWRLLPHDFPPWSPAVAGWLLLALG
jgi:putative transposase